jgi:hypothetical protein
MAYVGIGMGSSLKDFDTMMYFSLHTLINVRTSI